MPALLYVQSEQHDGKLGSPCLAGVFETVQDAANAAILKMDSSEPDGYYSEGASAKPPAGYPFRIYESISFTGRPGDTPRVKVRYTVLDVPFSKPSE